MFRFTIRELVLVTVIVGLVVGWVVDRWNTTPTKIWERRARATAEFLREDGWTVSWENNGVSLEKPNAIRGRDWPPP